jgi:hypothetical protein
VPILCFLPCLMSGISTFESRTPSSSRIMRLVSISRARGEIIAFSIIVNRSFAR